MFELHFFFIRFTFLTPLILSYFCTSRPFLSFTFFVFKFLSILLSLSDHILFFSYFHTLPLLFPHTDLFPSSFYFLSFLFWFRHLSSNLHTFFDLFHVLFHLVSHIFYVLCSDFFFVVSFPLYSLSCFSLSFQSFSFYPFFTLVALIFPSSPRVLFFFALSFTSLFLHFFIILIYFIHLTLLSALLFITAGHTGWNSWISANISRSQRNTY